MREDGWGLRVRLRAKGGLGQSLKCARAIGPCDRASVLKEVLVKVSSARGRTGLAAHLRAEACPHTRAAAGCLGRQGVGPIPSAFAREVCLVCVTPVDMSPQRGL